MPSKSIAQHNFMEGCAHNPSGMKGKCPPASVAKEYAEADKRHHFKGASMHKGWLQAFQSKHGIK